MAHVVKHQANENKTVDLFFDVPPSKAEISSACDSLGFKWADDIDSGWEPYGTFPKQIRVKGVLPAAPAPAAKPAPPDAKPAAVTAAAPVAK